jgi:mutator protein MutT
MGMAMTETPQDRTDVVIGIVGRAGQVLICQRPAGKSFAGFWEFPGGKREAGETIEQCLRRELREELAIEVTPVRALSTIDHDYPRGRIRLHPWLCDHHRGEPQLLAVQRVLWVEPLELKDYQFPPANDALIAEAIESLLAPRRHRKVDFPTRGS